MAIRIVLVGTTHPGNIGACARAMKNMGLAELALVAPRHFPHEEATARASGADDILAAATVAETLPEAIGDCVYVAGTSARSRAIAWPSLDAHECAPTLLDRSRSGTVACVFGPEKSGLSNAHLDLCDLLVTIPANPEFSSLNLAMAVQIITYELRVAGLSGQTPAASAAEVPPATSAELEYFYEHLERVLTDIRFLDPENPRTLMRRLRRLYIRAQPDQNEIHILRGILTAIDRLGAGS